MRLWQHEPLTQHLPPVSKPLVEREELTLLILAARTSRQPLYDSPPSLTATQKLIVHPTDTENIGSLHFILQLRGEVERREGEIGVVGWTSG